MLSNKQVIYSEEYLISMLQKQDRTAFEYLYDRYSAALLGILMRSVQDEDIANDLLQDVFVKIWKNIAQYDSNKGKLYTWMINITRNTGFDYVKSKANRQSSQNFTLEDQSNSVDTNIHVSQNIELIGVKNLLEKLPIEQKNLIEYIYFKGYTQDETSKHFNLPLGTVKTRTRAAIIELRKYFK
jgi:RNA polymerase sigma-70 factor (ECF subfamily)